MNDRLSLKSLHKPGDDNVTDCIYIYILMLHKRVSHSMDLDSELSGCCCCFLNLEQGIMSALVVCLQKLQKAASQFQPG